MAQSISVRCSYCGKEIGNVSFVPGEQIIGCSCGGRTKIIIYKDGTINSFGYKRP